MQPSILVECDLLKRIGEDSSVEYLVRLFRCALGSRAAMKASRASMTFGSFFPMAFPHVDAPWCSRHPAAMRMTCSGGDHP